MNPYAKQLAAAWQAHLAPRAADAPTVISTFAGTGGSSLGYSMSGYRELLASDWEQNAVDCFRLNFPDVPVFHGDIAALSVNDVLSRTGLRPGELDVFDGSPPCQGFSTSGKRDFGDNRNQLFREFVRLLRGLRPRAMVMENVSGMVKGGMKLTFAECLRELKSSGYRVAARLLNAKYYGVPQGRERLIFIGVRDDLGIEPTHPAPFSRPITAREAIADVVNDPAEHAMLIAGGKKYASYADWHRIPYGHSRQSALGLSGFNCIKVHPDKPSNTVRKSDGEIGMHGLMHWAERRRFTIAEFKRLCSFPDAFQFTGTYSDAVNRMGNSVPPLFMRAVAQHIRDTILIQQKRSAA